MNIHGEHVQQWIQCVQNDQDVVEGVTMDNEILLWRETQGFQQGIHWVQRNQADGVNMIF